MSSNTFDDDNVVYFEKDPDETEKFLVDWTDRLNGSSISTSSWVVPSGITKVSDGIETGLVKTNVILSGGTAGETYDLTNRIDPGGGLVWDEVIRIKVLEKAVNT